MERRAAHAQEDAQLLFMVSLDRLLLPLTNNSHSSLPILKPEVSDCRKRVAVVEPTWILRRTIRTPVVSGHIMDELL